jgi:hypothetical protein
VIVRTLARVQLAVGLVVAAVLAGAPPAALAHVVYGTPTLWQQIRDADAVVEARIGDPGRLLELDGSRRRRVVTAEPLAILKGVLPEAANGARQDGLAFVPHGHGVAQYARGDRALLFLRRLERVRELASSPLAGRVQWVSVQESTDRVLIGDGADDAFLAAARAYVAVEALPAAARLDGLRRVTLRLLASREPRLAASAVRDLVAGELPLVADDVPTIDALTADRRVSVGTRIALLAELERRGLVAGPERWATLVRGTAGRDRVAVLRAAAAHPSVVLTHALLETLAGGTADEAAAAAVALGTPGNDAAVAALERALGVDDPRLRMAAIRGLGRIGTRRAREALAIAAAFHPDPPTRRRANAEVVVLARSGTE